MPTFSDVTLQLPLDGADGSTTFTDVSDSGLTLTATGSAQIDTAQSKWGGASLSLPANGSSLVASTPNAAFGFGTSPWTVEAWIRLTALGDSRVVFDFRDGSTNSGAHFLYVSFTGRLALYSSSVIGNAGTSITLNTWHHAAWCFDGSLLRIFLDGVVQWSGAFTKNLGATRPITIGKQHNSTTWQFFGHVDDVRMTKGAWYTADFTPPAGAHQQPVSGQILDEFGVLGQPAIFGATGVFGFSSDTSVIRSPSMLAKIPIVAFVDIHALLGAQHIVAFHDFTAQLNAAAPNRYTMDLVTPGGLVRVPISSWQATLQTDVQSYVQCVVPAATDWVPDIEVATEFVISRIGTLLDGSTIEYEMARAPAQTVSLDGGAYNYTATISGYTAALTAVENPPASLDRTLTGVRTISRNSGNTRVRCDIDWLLRPGQRAYLDAEPIIVSYVNYYVPGFDQYMDVGDRA